MHKYICILHVQVNVHLYTVLASFLVILQYKVDDKKIIGLAVGSQVGQAGLKY